MKCVIPGINVKVFGKAIHSLSKIGEELYIEPLEHGLAIRTVNSSRSAYACFLFAPSFFQHYDDGSGTINSQDSDEDSMRCKLTMKSCLTVFKSLSSIEKTVERCEIRLDIEEARMVFKMHCRHGIVKTHNLAYIECETLQAVFAKDNCPNKLTAPAKLLCDAVANFQTSQEEVTLISSSERVSVKNYVEDEPDPHKVMHTELTLLPEEFDFFRIEVESDITFCLKELRAILSFSDATNIPVSLHFNTAGRPIIFSIDSDKTFEGNFVLATLADAPSTQSCTQKPSQSQTSSRLKETSTAKRKSSKSIATDLVKENKKLEENKKSESKQNIPIDKNRNDREERLNAAYQCLLDDDMDMDDEPSDINATKNSKRDESPSFQKSNTSSESVRSPVIPIQDTRQKVKVSDVTILDDVEEDDEFVPGTPPKKRFCSMFFGSSQTSTQLSQTPRAPAIVLAADTDDEDD